MDGTLYKIDIVAEQTIDLKDGEKFSIFTNEERLDITACSHIRAGEVMIVYGKAWARSLASFLEILGDSEGSIGGTMYYRFEQVKNVPR